MHGLQQRAHMHDNKVEFRRRVPTLPLYDERTPRRPTRTDEELPWVPPGALERLRRRQGGRSDSHYEQPTVTIDDVRREEWERQPKEEDKPPKPERGSWEYKF